MRILLAADDHLPVVGIGSYFEEEACEVTQVSSVKAALEHVMEGMCDVVLLGSHLSGLANFDILSQVRQYSDVPVLLQHSNPMEDLKIRGFELGADDVLGTDCSPREVMARVRAILRRTGLKSSAGEDADRLVEGYLTLWPGERVAYIGEDKLELTSTEYTILELLVKNTGKPVPKATICREALGRSLARFDRSVDVHISSIRNKLSLASPGREYINTVVRVGYQFIKQPTLM